MGLMVAGSELVLTTAAWAEGPKAAPTNAQMIASAMSAAPAKVAGGATIVAMEANGTMRTLRKGTNAFTCMPDNPATPANEIHAAKAAVGTFVTPRRPILKLSGEIKAGAVTVPAGEYTIGVIKNSENDWTMALYPGAPPRPPEVTDVANAIDAVRTGRAVRIDVGNYEGGGGAPAAGALRTALRRLYACASLVGANHMTAKPS